MISVERGVTLDPRVLMSRRELIDLLERLMATLGLSGDLTLALVNEVTMANLNHCYRGCFGPTNVLSFSEEGERTLGLIVLCPTFYLLETRLYGQDQKLHLARLLVHSLLHLAGLKHGPKMETLTKSVLEKILA